MKHLSLRPLVAAISLALCAGTAFADPTYKLSGFGTLAAVHSDLDTADFTGSVFQPNGAGHTRSTTTTPDSKLGVQLNASFNSEWSAVAQVISQYQHDASYWPQLEWGNVTYKPTDALSLRVGRIALPAYLMSESRLVGYAHTWARPPQDVYGVLPLTSNDGIDATYRSKIGSAQNTVQAYYGTNEVKLAGGGTAKAKTSWGINDTVEVGSLTLRAAYTYLKEDLQIDSLAPLFAGMSMIPGLYEKYDPRNMNTHALALGAQYDPGDWFVMSEFVDYKGDGILSDSRSWYVAGGYRVGKFTPYLIHSEVKARIEEDTSPMSAFITPLLYQANATQKTTAVGVRYDVYKNTAIKLQYDRVQTGSRSNGRLKTEAQPGNNWGFVPGSKANVVTLGVDFVF
ncbi:porin [Piscinibacter gummiphilus]|uniref:Porin n=1 Tax=Piscinibacter gummiphilus TaxID=946333 RepID=A0ABZ0CTZ1_9BURK|nr:porin [Piscinibacter gummiphilus]WOB08001.1 porin [Piscinibacter gummiphilus]